MRLKTRKIRVDFFLRNSHTLRKIEVVILKIRKIILYLGQQTKQSFLLLLILSFICILVSFIYFLNISFPHVSAQRILSLRFSCQENTPEASIDLGMQEVSFL